MLSATDIKTFVQHISASHYSVKQDREYQVINMARFLVSVIGVLCLVAALAEAGNDHLFTRVVEPPARKVVLQYQPEVVETVPQYEVPTYVSRVPQVVRTRPVSTGYSYVRVSDNRYHVPSVGRVQYEEPLVRPAVVATPGYRVPGSVHYGYNGFGGLAGYRPEYVKSVYRTGY